MRAQTGLACSVACVLGSASFGAFAQADLLWRNMETGYNVLWRSGDYLDTVPMARVASQDWQVVGSLSQTVIWRNRADGRNVYWLWADAASAWAIPSVPSQSWIVAGAGSFYSAFDLVWHDNATGRTVLWLWNGMGWTSRPLATVA